MAGDAVQWCWDVYDVSEAGAPDFVDPQGPKSGFSLGRWRHCRRLAARAAEFLVPVMEGVQKLASARAGSPGEGILHQPFEGGIAMRFLLRRTSPLFVERLQE